jgi:hypothetical protein
MEFPRRFFRKIVGGALREGSFDIEIRCLGKRHEHDSIRPVQFWVRSVNELQKQWVEIEDRNSSGFDIHYTVLPRLRKIHGKKEHPLPDIPIVSCVWADLDVGRGKPYRRLTDALHKMRDTEPYPNIVVESGTGLHLYWLVEIAEIEKDRLETLLRIIAKKFDGDTGASRASRLMRVPNTINWKQGGEGKVAKAFFMGSERYRFKDLEKQFRVGEAEPTDADQMEGVPYHRLFSDHLDGFNCNRHGAEATALCPFHPDKHPSFAANLKTGLWLCRAESCKAKGNAEQFCEMLQIPVSRELLDRSSGESAPRKAWTRPKLSKRALFGLAGHIVRAIGPHTESDTAAILVQLLVAFGNCIGPSPHFEIEATKHRANLFSIIVGRSSRARKGTSWAQVRRLFVRLDKRWCENQIITGLSSGEGLIWAARDRHENGDSSTKVRTDDALAPSTDKRLMVIQSEFSRVLKVQRREGNTLSSVLRSAWDSETLTILTKNAPAKATGAHVSIIGHITQDELRRELRATDEANGYANRFLFVYVERTKYLPFGGTLDEQTLTELAARLVRARHFARCVGEVRFSKKARKRWRRLYIRLSKETPGMLGAITSRAEAQVLRLAMIYALLDRSKEIKTYHLEAASALWRYCEQSAEFIFGGTLGNPVADEICRALNRKTGGLTRDDIRELFQHNRDKEEIDQALSLLENSGLARSHRERTKGRAAERWTAA